MYVLNHDLLLKDYLQKLIKDKISQKAAATKMQIGRSTVMKLNNKQYLTHKPFFKICNWLNENPEKYLIKVKGTKKTDWKTQKKF
jgi:plasmid maintenance system antidote protein VapI